MEISRLTEFGKGGAPPPPPQSQTHSWLPVPAWAGQHPHVRWWRQVEDPDGPALPCQWLESAARPVHSEREGSDCLVPSPLDGYPTSYLPHWLPISLGTYPPGYPPAWVATSLGT